MSLRVGRCRHRQNGVIGTADKVVYGWAPLQQRFMWYAGRANELQQLGELQIAAGLFPRGTEFLHTVRYIDVDQVGDMKLAARIREVRYARKRSWLNYSQLRARADSEFKEKHDFPNRLRTIIGNHESGIDNGQGWTYAAFIEDASGELRPQTYEELVFCAGCHGGISATRDGIFSFARKTSYDDYRHGWYHWSQKSIKELDDPLRADGKHEYAYYLEQNGASDEFLANDEIMRRFFDRNGRFETDMLARLENDISELLWPSAQRAMQLNKAYKTIIQEQSFIHGRDAMLAPPVNVHEKVDADQSTGIRQPAITQKLAF